MRRKWSNWLCHKLNFELKAKLIPVCKLCTIMENEHDIQLYLARALRGNLGHGSKGNKLFPDQQNNSCLTIFPL